MRTEDRTQYLVRQDAFTRAFRTVKDPCSAGAVTGLHDGCHPVDEVVDDGLIAAKSMREDFVDGGRDGLGGLAHAQHDLRGLEAINDAVLGIDTNHVGGIEDQVPFRDEVSDGYAVLLGEVT